MKLRALLCAALFVTLALIVSMPSATPSVGVSLCRPPGLATFAHLVTQGSDAMVALGKPPLAAVQQAVIAGLAYHAYLGIEADDGLASACAKLNGGQYLVQSESDAQAIRQFHIGLNWYDSLAHGRYRTVSIDQDGTIFVSEIHQDDYPLIFMGKPSSSSASISPILRDLPTKSQFAFSQNWGGRSYAYGNDWLTEVLTDIRVPAPAAPDVAPANVPPGVPAPHATVAPWDGLSANSDGSGTGGLGQTGIYADYTSHSPNFVWYEDYPGPSYQFAGATDLATGDYLRLIVQIGAGPTDPNVYDYWYFTDTDLTTGFTWTATAPSVDPGTTTVPHFAHYIVEAASTGGVTDQIARLNAPINFYDAFFYDEDTFLAVRTNAPGASYILSQLMQEWPCCNLDDGYSASNGGYFNSPGYETIQWRTSAYDWDCANYQVC